MTFQQTKTWKKSTDPDPDFDAKLDRIEYTLSERPERAFAFDEFAPLGIRPTAGPRRAKQGKPDRLPARVLGLGHGPALGDEFRDELLVRDGHIAHRAPRGLRDEVRHFAEGQIEGPGNRRKFHPPVTRRRVPAGTPTCQRPRPCERGAAVGAMAGSCQPPLVRRAQEFRASVASFQLQMENHTPLTR